MTRGLTRGVLAMFVAYTAMMGSARAQQTIVVSVPATVSFTVTNISETTVGTPAPTTIQVVNPLGFANGDKVRISIKSDTADFSGPGGTAISASAITWTATATGGNPSNGTLSSTTYAEVFRSTGKSAAGMAFLTWRVGPISASGVRAGTHTLNVRWKFEVF